MTLPYLAWDRFDVEAMLDMFEEQNPGIEVEAIMLTGSSVTWPEQIYTRRAAGLQMDVVSLHDSYGLEFMMRDMLLPLEDVATKYNSGFLDGFLDGTLDAFSYRGELYGLQWLQIMAASYNKTVFAESGVARPDDTTWTWEEAFEIGRQMTQLGANGEFEVVGWWYSEMGGTLWERAFIDFLTPYGTYLYSEDRRQIFPDDEVARQVIEFLVEGVRTGALQPQGATSAFYGANRAALHPIGVWNVPAVQAAYEDGWDIGLLRTPSGPAGTFSRTLQWGFGISPDTRNVEAAWKLVEFLSLDGLEKFGLPTGAWLPVREDHLAGDAWRERNPWEDTQVWEHAIRTAFAMRRSPQSAQFSRDLLGDWRRVYRGETAVPTFMELARTRHQALMSEFDGR